MRALPTILVAVTLAAVVAEDLVGQRGRGRRRREAPPPAEAPPPKEQPPEPESKSVEHWVAITGADVYLGTGQILRRASVVIGDDKITAVGHDLEIPEGAEVIDATGRVLAPGFVAASASGLGAPDSLSDGEAEDSLNPFDPGIKMALAAGITSYLATFDRGTDQPGGSSAVIKLIPGNLEGAIVAKNSALTMRVPLDAKKWHELRELVDKAKEKIAEDGEQKGDGDKKDGGDRKDEKLDAAIRVLRGEARLWVSCERGYDLANVRQALDIARLFGHGVVLDDPIAAWAVADEVAETGSMAVINPRARELPDPARPETTGSHIGAAAILSQAGVPVAVRPPGGRFGGSTVGTGGILGQDLHTLAIDAAFAVRGGLDNQKALRTITLDSARLIGAEARVGSIEVGKDADLLILDGDPLHYRTFVQTAIVNGKVVYQKDKEPFYSHIER